MLSGAGNQYHQNNNTGGREGGGGERLFWNLPVVLLFLFYFILFYFILHTGSMEIGVQNCSKEQECNLSSLLTRWAGYKFNK